MVLVNGSEGIGTGWSSNIPNYNPRDIVKNLLRKLNGEEFQRMDPYYKGFKGKIERNEKNDYDCHGIFEADLFNSLLTIKELPIKIGTDKYKKKLDEIIEKRNSDVIIDFKEYHTTTTVDFEIKMNENFFN